jgi:hypothetical protein
MYTQDDIVSLILQRQASLPRGQQATISIYDWQIDRSSFTPFIRVPGLDKGQIEDRRYELLDRRSLHEWIFINGRSEFHIDEGHPGDVQGVVRHALKDTKAVLGAVVGYGASFVIGAPAWVLAGVGTLLGSRMARKRIVRNARR